MAEDPPIYIKDAQTLLERFGQQLLHVPQNLDRNQYDQSSFYGSPRRNAYHERWGQQNQEDALKYLQGISFQVVEDVTIPVQPEANWQKEGF